NRWRKLELSGPLPSRREYHSAAFDPVGRRMIVVGGSAAYGDVGRTWILDVNQRALNARIDVLPGSSRNPVEPRSRGKLPVAVFGSADLAVSSLELSRLRLAGAPVTTLPNGGFHTHREYVDNDGIMDMLVHFDRDSLALDSTD